MFETVAEGEMPIPGTLLPEGVRAWQFIYRTVETPWFCIRYRDEHSTIGTILVGSTEQFVHLLESGAVGCGVILNVQLVTPSWINGSQGWTMQHLVEFWKGFLPEKGHAGYRFVFLGGACSVCGPLGSPEKGLRDERLLFRQPDGELSGNVH